MESKWKIFLERVKERGKIPGKNQLLLIFLIGVLLLVIAYPTSGKKRSETEETKNAVTQNMQNSLENYEEYLEHRLSAALESVEGVGRAEVVITLKSSAEKVVEKDQSTAQQSSSEQSDAGSVRSSEDKTLDGTSVYERQSDGTETPYVSKELTPEIMGVVVIADGGDNAIVIQNITEAVQALFGVEAHKIKIMKRTDT